eukprot:gene11952-biopygen21436
MCVYARARARVTTQQCTHQKERERRLPHRVRGRPAPLRNMTHGPRAVNACCPFSQGADQRAHQDADRGTHPRADQGETTRHAFDTPHDEIRRNGHGPHADRTREVPFLTGCRRAGQPGCQLAGQPGRPPRTPRPAPLLHLSLPLHTSQDPVVDRKSQFMLQQGTHVLGRLPHINLSWENILAPGAGRRAGKPCSWGVPGLRGRCWNERNVLEKRATILAIRTQRMENEVSRDSRWKAELLPEAIRIIGPHFPRGGSGSDRGAN